MICNVLAAEYTQGSASRSPVLDLNRIVDGHRTHVISFRVTGKREARALAKQYGAKTWNF
jgi:hypothetical protein